MNFFKQNRKFRSLCKKKHWKLKWRQKHKSQQTRGITTSNNFTWINFNNNNFKCIKKLNFRNHVKKIMWEKKEKHFYQNQKNSRNFFPPLTEKKHSFNSIHKQHCRKIWIELESQRKKFFMWWRWLLLFMNKLLFCDFNIKFNIKFLI